LTVLLTSDNVIVGQKEVGMRAAIYTRLSKNRKGKAANVKEQERDCREFVEAQGWQLVDVYTDDGISASDKSTKPRFAFQRLIGDVKDHHIDMIVATEFTRLYRRPRELEELLDPVDKFHYDVELYTVDDNRRWDIKTPVGRAALREAAKQAAWYSDYVSDKVKRKAKHRARDGRWHGGDPGYGFSYIKAVRDSEGQIIEDERVLINEEQAAVIREVVKRILTDQRVQTVINDLNRRGIPTRQGRQWRQGNLHPILVKPAIAGLVRHPELPELVKARWDPIVSEDDWRKLQLILSNPDRRKGSVTTRTSLLVGYVYCGHLECGKPMTSSRNRDGKRVYDCRRTSSRQGCDKLRRLADPVDQLVTETIISTLEDSDFAIPVSDDDEFTSLLAEKKELEDSLAQLAIDHYRLRVIKRPAFLAANEALEADLAAIQRRLDRATTYRHVKEIPVGEIAQQEWDAHADDMAWRRELIGMLIEKVIIHPSPHYHPAYNPHFGARFDPDLVEIVPRKLRQGPGTAAR